MQLSRCLSTFCRHIFPPYSGLKYKQNKTPETRRLKIERLFLAGFFFDLQLDPEDRGNKFLRNVSGLTHDFTELYPRRFRSIIAQSVSSLPRRPVFDLRSGHVRFVEDKVTQV
jgi:hypothetical protein